MSGDKVLSLVRMRRAGATFEILPSCKVVEHPSIAVAVNARQRLADSRWFYRCGDVEGGMSFDELLALLYIVGTMEGAEQQLRWPGAEGRVSIDVPCNVERISATVIRHLLVDAGVVPASVAAAASADC